ncbi:replication endonuclease [Pseudidiomarina salinarum]|uniref:replication endonuclease n=1 Tax=Pseudidiomarina salinarum TaxID=435908 RepID=UPI000B128733|nr:replication endonuclease [Pseudidiomarina salinarum]
MRSSTPEYPPETQKRHPLSTPGANFLLPNTLLNRVLRDYQSYDVAQASMLLRDIQDYLRIDDLDLAEPDSHRNFANAQAISCRRIRSEYPQDMALHLCKQRFDNYQLGELKFDDEAILKRLSDRAFWLRRIRSKTNETIAEVERLLHLVSAHRGIYCGDKTLALFDESQQKSEEFLSRSMLVCKDGEQVSLAEISKHTISNPDILFAEWMVRVRGFEEVAEHFHHAAVMVTVSTPSRMHPILKASGKPNPKFDGTSPKEANDYLNHVWQLIRAKFARADISPYGMRVAEPNHDGTPHWHILLFIAPDKLKPLKRIVKHYALKESPNEKGARKYRVNFVDIDPNKGSAAGYLAKYIAKNINGIKGKAESDAGGRVAARRTRAWASAHGIRKFAQIGGPRVTVWRELRRLTNPVKDSTLEKLRLAADSSNWAAFCLLMGGVGDRGRIDVHPMYSSASANQDYHELANVNQYGEPRRPRIIGIRHSVKLILTRFRSWYGVLPQEPPNIEAPMLH